MPAINSANTTNSALVPTPGNVPDAARWGSIMVAAGASIVMNEATVEYAGGFVNTTDGTSWARNALYFDANIGGSRLGAYAYITDNNFYDNQDAPIAADVNAFYAGDPLRPLLSGAPFFRGNVLLRNDINGLAVLSNVLETYQGFVEVQQVSATNGATLYVDSVWQNTDITYVVRGTIILAGRSGFFSNNDSRPLPSTTYNPNNPDQLLSPSQTLTIQSQLPGTLLADGSSIARPGESMVVKFLNDPLGIGAPPGDNVNGSNGAGSAENAGAGFIVGVDDGVDPPANTRLVGAGLDSQLRIIGIGANETTGQQRVPVIFTSLLDSSVTRTVRGIDQSQTYAKPVARYIPVLGTRTTPQAGDGGLIYFGGLMLTDYNLWDPRDGSIIMDADLSYMTRVEVQGGGAPDVFNTNPTTDPAGENQNDTFDANDNPRAQKAGVRNFSTILAAGPPVLYGFVSNSALNEFNSAQAMTIANSNFNYFSSADILVHPGPASGLARNVGTTLGSGDTAIRRGQYFRMGGIAGQPVDLLVYNNVFNTAPVGVRVNSETGADTLAQDVYNITLMNNTFYNTGVGLHTVSPQRTVDPPNWYSSVNWMALNNIFSNNATAAIWFEGQQWNSQAQYNVYWQNGQNVIIGEASPLGWGGDNGPIYGDPKFRNAAGGDFRLMAGSAAIDAGRSEVGPLEIGNSLAPVTNQDFSNSGLAGTRNYNGRLGGEFSDFPFGDGYAFYQTTDIVALPGYSLRNYFDQWVPALAGSDGSYTGSAAAPGTFAFVPVNSQRDQSGYQRLDDPTTPNTGFGSEPFFDAGAMEYRAINPPKVTQVQVVGSPNATPSNFYTTTGIASSNQTPQEIDIKFNTAMDASTFSSLTVLLQQSGGDGIFGNGNSANDRSINLSGRLLYDATAGVLRIYLAQSVQGGGVLTLADDKYRIVLVGTGSTVITDTSGLALDGENTSNNNDPNGNQLALPSGDDFPGGNFTLNFIINATPPSLTTGSFKLSPSSDTNVVGDLVTNNPTPTFTGTVTVSNPLIQPVAGQIVVIDVSTSGAKDANGNVIFDRMNAGTALTDASGNFAVTIGTDGANTGLVTNSAGLSSSNYNVGPDGKLVPISADGSGFSIARIRIIDSGGNSSNTTDPNYRTTFVEDNKAPTVSITSPASGAVVTTSNGQITFEISANENLDTTKLNANSIQVVRAGADGLLGTADDVTVSINTGSIVTSYLDTGTGGTGRMKITFTTTGTQINDTYQIKLIGTGTNGIRDIAGNLVGSDLTTTFAVNDPTLSHLIYVGASSYVTDPSATQGSRSNPYSTINAGLAAAGVGDYVAALPGVYRETVNLKQFVHLVSADISSTDTTLVNGNALYTVIRAPYSASGSGVSVIANNLASYGELDTEIRGFSIDTPLVGNAANGFIGSSSVGLSITNSDVLVRNNYFIDAAYGIAVYTSGSSALTPRIYSNAIIGNGTGILLFDAGTSSLSKMTQIYNNTIANNTDGISAINSSSSPAQATIANNIFWANHDQSIFRNGLAIYSDSVNKLFVRNNLFSANGVSENSTGDDTVNVGNGFNPAALSSLAPDSLGNFTGNPSFVSPRDPRPGSDGPAVFYLDGNFSLTSQSAAIDRANPTYAPSTDLLYRTRVRFRASDPSFPGTGPADVGAFEYNGGGGTAIGGTFRVVTTSVAGGATAADGATVDSSLAPKTLTVTLSANVDRSTVSASDLVLSGSGVNAINPIHATSLTWIDDHTVEFLLSGQYNENGTVNIAIPAGAIKSTTGSLLPAYSDKIVLAVPAAAVIPTPTPTPTFTPTATPAAVTPVPAASPAPAASPRKKHKVVIRKAHPKPKPHRPVKAKAHKPAIKTGKVQKIGRAAQFRIKLHK